MMVRKLVFLLTMVMTLAVAAPAWATKPIREVRSQDDVVITDQCDFPVLGHIDGTEIITTWLDDAGNPVRQIVAFPHNRMTLTNPEQGASVTVVSTGSSQLRLQPDGSTSARAMGHGMFFPNPLTGEPGLWFLSGQGEAILDPQGNVTSVSLAGRLVDLCAELAS
jgi:hypothetical protein